MAAIGICHGVFDGGWFWKEPANLLCKLGHHAYTPTLTGLGERIHLGTPQTDLETHIKDILNVFLYEELDDAILVGHSYGGAVVSGGVEFPETSGSLFTWMD